MSDLAAQNAKPVRLLFLIADTGAGHRASARAVKRCLQNHYPDRFTVTTIDPFAQASSKITRPLTNLYTPLIRHARWLWHGLYRASNSRFGMKILNRTALRMVDRGIERTISHVQPDLVVSFHPLLNHAAVRVAAKLATNVPIVTVVTDLVNVHRAWFCLDVDALLLPSEAARLQAIAAGVSAKKCFVTGLPVDESFFVASTNARNGRTESRQRLSIAPTVFTVLFSVGGEPKRAVTQRVLATLQLPFHPVVIVICGHNRRAQTALEKLAASVALSEEKIASNYNARLVVRGFVDNMADWMRACDVMVTKAGPGTIAEAAATQTPLLFMSYVAGQESDNVGYVTKNGGARYVPNPNNMTAAISECASHPQMLEAMRTSIAGLAQSRATQLICEQLLITCSHDPVV